MDQRLLNRHQAAINVAKLESRRAADQGNILLRKAKWGVNKGGTVAPKTIDDIAIADALRAALHGEGPVPEGMEDVFNLAKQQTDFESAARIDFDPEMATVENYFDRGWKPPEAIASAKHDSMGRLVTPPGFRLPRVNATYKEMRELGYEPLFWNPFEQVNFSSMKGVRYRQQMELVATLKELGDEIIMPWSGRESGIPAGYRVPKVGEAFEGKPFAAIDPVTGDPIVATTRRFIVRNKVANSLENMYGKKPDLGTVHVGGKDMDIIKVVDWAVFTPKRVKLIGSFFQDLDFLIRLGAGAWTKSVDDLLAGKPISAVQSLLQYPVDALDVLRARALPGRRNALKDIALSTKPLIEGRPGVNMRKIMEANLNLTDRTFLPANLDEIVNETAAEAGVLGIKSVARGIKDFERAFRNSLFSGTYPAAILNDVRHNIAPILARTYPDLTDAQLVARIAEQANIKYSTIPEAMSAVQNRFLRESLLRVFFSLGESEGLLRQGTRAFKGPNKKFWAKHWLGTYLFLISTANIIHFSTTGEPLPKERYSPISKTSWGPLPFGYNTQFASPELPGKLGREGIGATLDLVGQMDTVFRVLNPKQFTESRFSVPIRGGINQSSGTDFYGESITEVGPGGIVSRTAQLAIDMFAPIGVGKIAQRLVSENIPGADKVLTQGDIQLSTTGLAIEAGGVNLRARPRSGIIDRESQKRFGKNIDDLNQLERYEIGQDPEIGSQLAQLDKENSERGNKIAGYRVQKLEDEAIAYEREYADLMTMITALANIEEYNETWNILKTFADNIGEVKGTLATQLERSRKEKGLDGYVGEEPKNEFDQMLNEWYELFDSHTSTVLNPSGGQAKHRLNFDTWVPASDEFVAALSPELQEQLQQWRDRKQEPEGVQAILEARRPNADKYGLNEEGEPKGPNNEQLFSEVQRVLVELGWTKAQFHSLRESK